MGFIAETLDSCGPMTSPIRGAQKKAPGRRLVFFGTGAEMLGFTRDARSLQGPCGSVRDIPRGAIYLDNLARRGHMGELPKFHRRSNAEIQGGGD